MTREITDLLQHRLGTGRKVVYVCGLGGSGKTRFCEDLRQDLGGITFSSDWYAKYPSKIRHQRMKQAVESGDAERIEAEENPKNWYDWTALLEDSRELRAGRRVTIERAWNQQTGEKDLTLNLRCPAGRPIWCDGIYLLHPPVKQAADLIILLQASPQAVRERAETRDSHRSSPEYLAYKDELMRKYDLPYFEALKSNADIVIDNSDYANPAVLRA